MTVTRSGSLPAQHVLLFLPTFLLKRKLEASQLIQSLGMTNPYDDPKKWPKTVVRMLKRITAGDPRVIDMMADNLERYCDENTADALCLKKKFTADAVNTYLRVLGLQQAAGDDDVPITTCRKITEIILNYMDTDEAAKYLVRHSYEALRNVLTEAQHANDHFAEDDPFLRNMHLRAEIFLGFLRLRATMPKPGNWYFELLKMLSKSSQNRPLASAIDQDFERTLMEYDIRVQSENRAPDISKDLLIDENIVLNGPRPQSDFGKRPMEITGATTHNYTLRSYQNELATKANQGMNTIICAPTGSGKTHVAVDIMVQHLRKLKTSDSVGRVVMFVPTIPLVDQQYQRIHRILQPEFCVTRMSGADRVNGNTTDRANEVLKADVAVMTPQVFINMLLSPLKSQHIYLSDFTLMIFDECHHCDENHPYKVLMDYVRKEPQTKVQIVGLTASVGVGKSKTTGNMNAEAAINHIIGLCARLNVTTISSVKQNLEDLRNNVSQPVDEIIQLRPSENDKFAHSVALLSDFVQEQLDLEVNLIKEKVLELADKERIKLAYEGAANERNGTCKTTVEYNNRLGNLKSILMKNSFPDKDCREFMQRCVQLLEICHFTLRRNELLPSSYAMEYFNSSLNEFDNNARQFLVHDKRSADRRYRQRLNELVQHFLGCISQLQQLSKESSEGEEKPILKRLIEIIVDQNADSRILIFVETRKCCSQLQAYLNSHKNIVEKFGQNQVGYIVSVNQSAMQSGQTSASQQYTLEAFRSGMKHILVATSVAEEGLDVAECQLIVKYNSVGSEKSYIQRKGRARAKGSKSVLLALHDHIEQQEYANIMREYLMNMCIKSLQCETESRLRNMIEKESKKMELEAHNNERRRTADAGSKYLIECGTCGTHICTSDEIYRLADNKFVCSNSDAWNGTTISNERVSAKSNLSNISLMCGRWKCGCGTDRGDVVKYAEVFMPTLSANGFHLRVQSNGPVVQFRSKPSWKIIQTDYFYPPQITAKILNLMSYSLRDPKLRSAAEQNEKLNSAEFLHITHKKRHAIITDDD